MRAMLKAQTKKRLQGVGEIALVSYVALVIGIAILRAVTGSPTVAELASSPALIMHGEWWRLITSAFVIEGPPVPQIIAIAVLGTFGIYFGGSWTFWSTAVAGHLLGTLLAYAGIMAVWLGDRAAMARYLTDPDYGVSLVWCAALGAFAALAWLGGKANPKRPSHPIVAMMTVVALLVVTFYSDDMAAVQHVIAFVIGLVIIATAGRSRALYGDRRRLRSLRFPAAKPSLRRS